MVSRPRSILLAALPIYSHPAANVRLCGRSQSGAESLIAVYCLPINRTLNQGDSAFDSHPQSTPSRFLVYFLYRQLNLHRETPVMTSQTGLLLLPLTLAVSLCAQTGAANHVVPIPSATEQEIAATDQANPYPVPQGIYAAPPTMSLIPHSPLAHAGSVWLRSTPNGLHIFGRVQASDDNFRWPRQKSEMLSSDHVEVWLAASPDVSMPDIGWGNQFGPNVLASGKDCAKLLTDINNGSVPQIAACERWYNQQTQYRQYLRRLFVRQWLIAGDESTGRAHVFEDFASAAWAGLSTSFFSEDLPGAFVALDVGALLAFGHHVIEQRAPVLARFPILVLDDDEGWIVVLRDDAAERAIAAEFGLGRHARPTERSALV